MPELDNIAIVCVCDDHYAILLAALIKSIESNHHTAEKLEFFIVQDEITSKSQQKIESSVDRGKTILHWLPLADCIPANAKLPVDNSSAPLNVYARLYIPHFVPKHIKKVIYLDVDMIVLEDISKLMAIDLEGKITAAVQDQFIQVVSRWGGVGNYEELGIDPDNKYFNSGLMIINLDQWEKANITDKVLDCIEKHKKHILYQDQYGLNAVLFADWTPLDPLWNRFAYSEEERPFLIHFTGRKPIYKSYEYSEKYRDIFYSYLKMTPWKNFRPIGEARRYFKKFNNIFEKFTKMLSFK